MNFKALFFLLFAAVLLFSLVAAENDEKNVELAKEETKEEEGGDDPTEPQQLRCRYGCCSRGPRGFCRRCCPPPQTAQADVDEDQQPVAQRCRYGCCLVQKGKPYRCLRCCPPSRPPQAEVLDASAADETATETQSVDWEQVNPLAEAARCRYGCCMWGRYGNCLRCCHPKHPPQAEAATEAKEPQN